MSALDELAEEEVVENPTMRAAYNMEPLHQNEPLHWDYKVTLIGKKIGDVPLHLCELCELPIRLYGRTLPCKHIFCFHCAMKCDKICGRCGLKVQKVEKSHLGSVYICTFGAPKHSTKGCRRTYLSQRDLVSHHAHRHIPKTTSSSSSKQHGQAISSSSNMNSSTIIATAQPVPNQLPMTQQQAQQQAAQQKLQQQQQQQHVARGLLSPGQVLQGSGMLPSTGVPVQVSPHLQGLTGHSSSPHLHQSPSPKLPLPQPQQQQVQHSMNHGYSGMPNQPNSGDVYRPLDLGGIGPNVQHQQQLGQVHHTQQQQGQIHLPQQQGPLLMTPGSHMQQGNQGLQSSYGQPAHFPVQHQQQHQLGVNNVQQNMMSPPIHQNPMSHQPQHHHHQQQQPHHLGPVSQGLDLYPPPNSLQNAVSSPGLSAMPNSAPHSRTNVNLITVPIQDEGQYRPPPYVNTSIGNQVNMPVSSFNPPSRSNPGIPAQHFAQQSLPGTFSPQLNTNGAPTAPGQNNMIALGPNNLNQGMQFNQGNQGNAPQGMNFNRAGAPRPSMGMGFNQAPGGQVSSPRMGFNQGGGQPFNQSNRPATQQFNPGIRMNQLGNMLPGAGVGRGNLASVVQAINMSSAIRPQGTGAPGGVILPPSVAPGQGNMGNARFPRWGGPRGMQPPRMGGNQAGGPPRPRDGGHNQGSYFN